MRLVNIPLALVLAATLVACTGKSPPRTGDLTVTPAVVLADEPAHIRVVGLEPGQSIELSASSVQLDGATWAASATFVADRAGTIDLDRDAPASGDYEGVDGMGLIAAMSEQPGPPETPTAPAGESEVSIAIAGGPEVTLRRVYLGSDVTRRSLTLAADGVVGNLFTPAQPTGPAVLLFGGSEGGESMLLEAAVLASRGHPTLSLTYFGAPGLPAGLKDIPVEYFATAAALLPGPVVVVGASRGTEAALLLAGLHPEMVSGVVLAAPNYRIIAAFPGPGNAWTVDGQPRTEISFDTIAAPVLALAGTDDAVWPQVGQSVVAHVQILSETLGPLLDTVVVEGAGHDILGLPYTSWDPVLTHPVSGQRLDMGGTRPGNERARRQTWAALLAFLETIQAGLR